MSVTLTLSTKSLLSALPFSETNHTPRARGLAWPILGGWGPSDPSSNLGGPTQLSLRSQCSKTQFLETRNLWFDMGL